MNEKNKSYFCEHQELHIFHSFKVGFPHRQTKAFVSVYGGPHFKSILHLSITRVKRAQITLDLHIKSKEGASPRCPHHKADLAHGILLGPAPGGCLVLGPVCLVHVSNLWYQGVIRIWVRQQGADGEQHLKKKTKTLPTHLKNSNDERECQGWKVIAYISHTTSILEFTLKQFLRNSRELT